MQVVLPVGWHKVLRTRDGLRVRAALRVGQPWAIRERLGSVVPEPVLTGLEAPGHRMVFGSGVR